MHRIPAGAVVVPPPPRRLRPLPSPRLVPSPRLRRPPRLRRRPRCPRCLSLLLVLLLGLGLPVGLPMEPIVAHAQPPTPTPTPTPVAIVNGAFDQGLDAGGVPVGWQKYGGSADATLASGPEGMGLVLDDQDAAKEIGVVQTIALAPSQGYEVTVQVQGFRGRSTSGAYVQLRFLPSQQYAQAALAATGTDAPEPITLRALAPDDTTGARLYLYTHATPTPKVLVMEVALLGGVEPPPPPPPDPVPPVYEQLKDMRLGIALASGGRPACSIVAPERYDRAAAVVRAAIEARTGVVVPVVSDTCAAAATPLVGNLVVLGNRSTNRTSGELYDRHYSLMDLKYPGPGGYAVRTLHDPYGNGFGAVLVGGSDDAGVMAAAAAFAESLASAQASPGELSVGWTMLTRLGDGLVVPEDVRDVEIWEASKGYGSVGYFGWNSISKRMAMFYMTGDARHAREFLFQDLVARMQRRQLRDQVLRHLPAVHVQHLVAVGDAVARQADDALDEVALVVGREEHHHVAALRRADVYDLGVQHRQPDATAMALDAEGIGDGPIRLNELSRVGGKGGLRTVTAPVRDFKVLESADDSVKVCFKLLRGCYATVLLREMMKPADPVFAGF